MKPWIVSSLSVTLFVLLWVTLSRESGEWVKAPNPSLETLIDLDADGFSPVVGAWEPRFPADHGAHPTFRSELWNLFGWLLDRQGRSYVFQVNLTRLALRAEAAERASAWATNQLFRGHLALILPGVASVLAEERLNRGALGLAGLSSEPVRIWLEDWSLSAPVDSDGLLLEIASDRTGLSLTLNPIKPSATSNDLELFGQGPGSPGFHLYLMPRLAVQGDLRLDGTQVQVQGTAWLDHAWGAISGASGQLALSRFAVQLDDGRDLMCLELRRRDGSGRPIPSCALIGSDGRVQAFGRREIRLEPVDEWRSPATGARYPLSWRLVLQPVGLELSLEPLLEDQELDPALRLWSGAVEVKGREGEAQLSGQGRVELTGLTRSGANEL